MEVKIKNSDNTLVDADWTIKDGVMVVSPKEVKFEPNDGDIVFVKANFEYVVIYKKANPFIGRYVSFNILNGNLYSNENDDLCHKYIVKEIRPATEEEKQKLFDKLAKEGLTWDAEKKMIFKRKFEPKDGDVLIGASHNPFIFKCIEFDNVHSYCGIDIHGALKMKSVNWTTVGSLRFATEEEKQKLFDKLAEEGYSWDAEKKELVELKWVPKDGDYYYYPACVDTGFVPLSTRYSASSSYDTGMAAKDWCFKTQQKCKTFCDHLNEAISKINP